MKIVQHRVNELAALRTTQHIFGCEIDLRNHGTDIYVTHDAFRKDGPLLEEWLDYFNNDFLILNVKEEGLEDKLFELMGKYSIEDYFILDETIPYIRKYALLGKTKFALRVSEIEPDVSAILLQSKLNSQGCSIDWVWVDTFSGKPLDAKTYTKLQNNGFKICQVSPELHQLDAPHKWQEMLIIFSEELAAQGTHLDMICTKVPEFWIKYSDNLANDTK